MKAFATPLEYLYVFMRFGNDSKWIFVELDFENKYDIWQKNTQMDGLWDKQNFKICIDCCRFTQIHWNRSDNLQSQNNFQFEHHSAFKKTRFLPLYEVE